MRFWPLPLAACLVAGNIQGNLAGGEVSSQKAEASAFSGLRDQDTDVSSTHASLIHTNRTSSQVDAAEAVLASKASTKELEDAMTEAEKEELRDEKEADLWVENHEKELGSEEESVTEQEQEEQEEEEVEAANFLDALNGKDNAGEKERLSALAEALTLASGTAAVKSREEAVEVRKSALVAEKVSISARKKAVDAKENALQARKRALEDRKTGVDARRLFDHGLSTLKAKQEDTMREDAATSQSVKEPQAQEEADAKAQEPQSPAEAEAETTAEETQAKAEADTEAAALHKADVHKKEREKKKELYAGALAERKPEYPNAGYAAEGSTLVVGDFSTSPDSTGEEKADAVTADALKTDEAAAPKATVAPYMASLKRGDVMTAPQLHSLQANVTELKNIATAAAAKVAATKAGSRSTMAAVYGVAFLSSALCLSVILSQRGDTGPARTAGGLTAASASALVVNKFAIYYLQTPLAVTLCQLLVTAAVARVVGLWTGVSMGTGSLSGGLGDGVFRGLWSLAACSLGLGAFGNVILQHSSIETIALLRATTPIIVCAGESALLGKSMPRPRPQLALMVAGAAAYMYVHLQAATYQFHVGHAIVMWYGAFICDQMFSKQLVAKLSLPTWTYVYYTNLFGAMLLSPVVLLTEGSAVHELLKVAHGDTHVSIWAGFVMLASSLVVSTSVSYFRFVGRVALTPSQSTVAGYGGYFVAVVASMFVACLSAALSQAADSPTKLGALCVVVALVAGLFYEDAEERDPRGVARGGLAAILPKATPSLPEGLTFTNFPSLRSQLLALADRRAKSQT